MPRLSQAGKKKPSAHRKANAASRTLNLKVEFARETDGRWIADIPAMPGVMCYGKTRNEALKNVKALALRVIADDLEEGAIKYDSISLTA
jgi:predicted RNase H-like HicB family nuclease